MVPFSSGVPLFPTLFICYRRIVYLHSKSDFKAGAVFCVDFVVFDTLEVVKHSFIFANSWHGIQQIGCLSFFGGVCGALVRQTTERTEGIQTVLIDGALFAESF